MFGAILLAVFLAALPWPWYLVSNLGGLNVRPIIITSVPIVIYFVWRSRFSFKPINVRVVGVLGLVYFVWLIPVIYYSYPHWSFAKLVSLSVYTGIAFFGARVYLLLTIERRWRWSWPLISGLFIASCIASYYAAFGTLALNPQIVTSTEFIHRGLYGEGAFSDPEAGRGIRHTMAMVPVFVLALTIHNLSSHWRWNLVISTMAIYLIFFSFSRSAWLAAFLLGLLMARGAFRGFPKNVKTVLVAAFTLLITLLVLMAMYPSELWWAWTIFEDRLDDDQSARNRLWIITDLLAHSTLTEWLIGHNYASQYSPHNLVLDALMQAGLLGAVGALIIAIFAIKTYIAGLLKGDFDRLVTAAFVTPALVRMFTAGSGMLHVVDLLGLFLAANFGWATRMAKANFARNNLQKRVKVRDRGPFSREGNIREGDIWDTPYDLR